MLFSLSMAPQLINMYCKTECKRDGSQWSTTIIFVLVFLDTLNSVYDTTLSNWNFKFITFKKHLIYINHTMVVFSKWKYTAGNWMGGRQRLCRGERVFLLLNCLQVMADDLIGESELWLCNRPWQAHLSAPDLPPSSLRRSEDNPPGQWIFIPQTIGMVD